MKNILVFVAHPKLKGSANLLAKSFQEALDKRSYKMESINLFKKQIPVYAIQDEKKIPAEIIKINEKWGKYIFGFTVAKFISKFYDGLGYRAGKVHEKIFRRY